MQFQQSEDEGSQSSQSMERYLQFTPLRQLSPMAKKGNAEEDSNTKQQFNRLYHSAKVDTTTPPNIIQEQEEQQSNMSPQFSKQNSDFPIFDEQSLKQQQQQSSQSNYQQSNRSLNLQSNRSQNAQSNQSQNQQSNRSQNHDSNIGKNQQSNRSQNHESNTGKNQESNRSKNQYSNSSQNQQSDSKQIIETPKLVHCQDKKDVSSILKLQNGKYSQSKQSYFEPIIKKHITEKERSNISSSNSPNEKEYSKTKSSLLKQYLQKTQQNLSSSFNHQPKQIKDDIIKKNKEKAGKPLEKKQKQKKLSESDQKPSAPVPVNEAQEKKFLEAVERIYLQDKRSKDAIKKQVEENEQKSGQFSHKPMICEKSEKILERKFKNQIQQIQKGQTNIEEHVQDYYKVYINKEKGVQADLIDGLVKLKDLFNIKQNKYVLEYVNQETNDQNQKIDIGIQTDELKISKKQLEINAQKYTLQQEQQQQDQQQEQDQSINPKDKKKKSNKKANKEVKEAKQKVQEKIEVKDFKKCEYYLPIHERYEQVIKKKERWVQEQIKIKKDEEEKLELEENEKKEKQVRLTQEQLTDFIRNQKTWMDNINTEIEKKRQDNSEKEIASLTFKPELTAKYTIITTEPVEERLQKFQQKKLENLKELEAKYLPQFKPDLKHYSNRLQYSQISKLKSNANLNETMKEQTMSARSKEFGL